MEIGQFFLFFSLQDSEPIPATPQHFRYKRRGHEGSVGARASESGVAWAQALFAALVSRDPLLCVLDWPHL